MKMELKNETDYIELQKAKNSAEIENYIDKLVLMLYILLIKYFEFE